MDFNKIDISRRSLAIAASLVGMVSLAIGAHAALNTRALDEAKVETGRVDTMADGPSRIALVIGNGHYPD
ncbi:MAG: caspase family protein, partial [Bradyrhizobium sp.]